MRPWPLVTLLVAALTAGPATDVAAETHWAYSGQLDPEHWSHSYPTCAGASQSPIDLNPDKATPMHPLPIHLGHYDTSEKMLHLINNGHSALVKLPRDYPASRVPFVKDGGLPNVFNFAQLHLHWGSDDGQGSEHTLRGKMFAAELHFVHYNTKYGTFENATKHPDGLAVLGVFVKVSSKGHAAFKAVAESLHQVVEDGHETLLAHPLSLQDLMPTDLDKFYRYSGSLTTPGCNEIVTWTVFDKPIYLSEIQMQKLRNLKTESGPMVNNYRPVQKLNSRTVYVRSGAATPVAAASSLLVALFAVYFVASHGIS